MKIEAYGISNVGMKRSQNEDNYLINETIQLYVVADGMGGHLGGEFASRMAVSTIEEVIERFENPDATQIHGINSEDAVYGERLRFAISEASRRIYEQGLYDESLKGMGTTAVAVMVNEEKAYIAHVGDSRAYLIRNGTIEQITEDHSLVTEQLKAGILAAEEVKGHRLKNIITRSVGYQEEAESDLDVLTLQVGDRLLLCSDGLSNMLDEAQILKIAETAPLKQACEKLIEAANQMGGDDNITTIIVQAIEK